VNFCPAGEVWYIRPSLAIWITAILVGVRREGGRLYGAVVGYDALSLALDGPRIGVHLVPGAYRASRMPAQ
jgi:hypothetical protein